ncbi:phosphoribosylaminoimidazolecarboxamide formyltransferase [Tengunoibacter tsumagoiensis]|uniref:5-aminoimidazole-4-carboxamide ribonucleotide transformylase n=1 Tax=Tengunoibacter tsumagoiensis TaxID=2014871 RepID=A0A402A267_9CHLR|nr:phosphoribosylaminoimidazolecarboxamide formyltransferase [Tengunoibacter tsumagoiensis]GCE13258.1 5-aminoimidazole-4-carboxamide ribonucleotide transformylase [Tengunoibacter tsumagoiensis]
MSNPTELKLRYGCNPYQAPARVFMNNGELPFKVLNGAPGYINLLDALNSWQLVKELRQVLNLPAAASFKHVSPAGAAVGLPLSETLKRAYGVEDLELSPLGNAYARARGADRLSSFGDWVALSDVVDLSTARLLNREVSDGVIAPGYEPAALELLQKKQKGRYIILEMDPTYEPEELERREVFGITFEQKHNTALASTEWLQNIPTSNKELPESAQRDLLIALIALKYTQSNSISFALDGQCIGIGAGQQSRIQCTRLAASKAANWYLRQHPRIAELPWKATVKRQDRVNAIDLYLRDDATAAELEPWKELFEEVPARLTAEEKQEWLKTLKNVALGSDAFIPFRDNVDCAAAYGVKYIAQPGGSLRDEDVIEACNIYDIAMAFTGVRLFHH